MFVCRAAAGYLSPRAASSTASIGSDEAPLRPFSAEGSRSSEAAEQDPDAHHAAGYKSPAATQRPESQERALRDLAMLAGGHHHHAHQQLAGGHHHHDHQQLAGGHHHHHHQLPALGTDFTGLLNRVSQGLPGYMPVDQPVDALAKGELPAEGMEPSGSGADSLDQPAGASDDAVSSAKDLGAALEELFTRHRLAIMEVRGLGFT
jgi:hypothetical protein